MSKWSRLDPAERGAAGRSLVLALLAPPRRAQEVDEQDVSLLVAVLVDVVHLGRAFRKLDVSSRRALPEVLARAASASG